MGCVPRGSDLGPGAVLRLIIRSKLCAALEDKTLIVMQCIRFAIRYKLKCKKPKWGRIGKKMSLLASVHAEPMAIVKFTFVLRMQELEGSKALPQLSIQRIRMAATAARQCFAELVPKTCCRMGIREAVVDENSRQSEED